MKFSFLFLFSILLSKIAMGYDIDKIRTNYIEAVNDSKKSEIFYKELIAIPKPDALILAYLGSVQAIRAKHAWNPVNKMNYLKQGSKTLDYAVDLASNNLEVRFLRFSLEHFLPTFLGYSQHLETDKNKILELLEHKNREGALKGKTIILKNIINFMIESKRCNLDEINSLKKIVV
jgi:hypothetical protein